MGFENSFVKPVSYLLVGLGVLLHVDTRAYKKENNQRLGSYENNTDQQI